MEEVRVLQKIESPQTKSVAMGSPIDGLVTKAFERYQWQEKNPYYYNDLKSFFNFHVEKGKSVLEIGFGVGPILDSCKPSLGMGLDLSEEVCNQAQSKYPKQKYCVWRGDKPLPEEVLQQFPNGVDYILLVNTVGFWQDIQESLGYLKKICNTNTRIISIYYNFLWAPIFHIAQKLHFKMPQSSLNWLSTQDTKNLFQLAGYRVVKEGQRCLVPKNLGPISYFINRFLAPLPLLEKLCCTHFVVARPHVQFKPEEIFASVIVPARNEKGNIEPAVQRLAQVAQTRKEKYEIIFVEGNSNDGTAEEITRVMSDSKISKPFSVSMYQQTGKGKGDAVRLGFSKAKGNLLLILDADLTVTPEDLPKIIDTYAEGHGEFINGCRLVYKMEKEAMRPINLLGNKFFGIAFSWILGQRFKDTLCGTKALSRYHYDRIAAGRSYFGDFDPFGDFDLIFGASKLDLEIVEVPIRYRDRMYGQTNISRWKHGFLLLKMCFYALWRIKFVI